MPKIPDSDVRGRLMSPDDGELSLWELGYAIDKRGPPIESVPADIVAGILMLAWPVAHRNKHTRYEPMASGQEAASGGWRTFLPRDLTPAHEDPLLRLAITSTHRQVKARVYDVLYERFNREAYGRNAIHYLLQGAKSHAGAEGWPELDAWCGRILFLTGRLKDPHLTRLALECHSEAAARVLGGSFRFAFSSFATALTHGTAKHLRTMRLLTDDAVLHWGRTLELLALCMRFRHEWMHLEQVREAQVLIYKLAGDVNAQKQAQRALINEMILESEVREEAATMALQRAMAMAADRGFSDLLDGAKARLADAVSRETARMKGHTISLKIDGEVISWLDEMIARAPDVSLVFRMMASQAAFTLLPYDDFRDSARKVVDSSPFYRMIGSTGFRNGNISHVAPGGDIEQKVKSYLSQSLGLHVAKLEALASRALTATFERGVNEHALFMALREPSWAAPHRLAQFAEASKHFARQDWFIAGTLLALVFEGFLRDWLRAAGYPAVKYDSGGTTGDEPLNSLAWNASVVSLLGGEYLAMIRFMLCDPECGLNIRNEAAHANAAPHLFTPGRVLLIALAIVRLTLIANAAVGEPMEAPTDVKGE